MSIRSWIRVLFFALSTCVAITAVHGKPHGVEPPLVRVAADGNTTELDEVLFVQALPQDNGKGGIYVIWIPQPLQKICMGKTAQQCINIDYCVRTTNRDDSRCKNLGIGASRLPVYPHDMRPRRLVGVVYYPQAPIQGMERLQGFYHSAPKSFFTHLSTGARIQARIRFTRSEDDDDFDLLEVRSVSPF